jgi:hypothetical protein
MPRVINGKRDYAAALPSTPSNSHCISINGQIASFYGN